MAVVAAVAAGATLGALAPLFETTSNSPAHVVHLILAAGWTWAALAFCVGVARKSIFESASLAPAALITAVASYYATKTAQSTSSQNDSLSRALFWSLAAAIVGAFLGVIGNLARSPGLRGLFFRALVPVIAIVETSQRLSAEASSQGTVVGATWNGIRIAAVAILAALLGHTVMRSWPRHFTSRRERGA
ncbi:MULTISPECIES: DUF6518 family protein [Streptomyces violaceoruber group]|uniref:DUF6518 family protein n=1 Tax=Streptomyces violaceoruber group TaxID=2867121 RepID=UPI00336A0BA4